MEIEYQDTSRRGKWIVAIGLLLALVAGGGAFFIVSQAQQQAGQAGVQTTAVVVAAREIPSRKVIDAADLEIHQLPLNETTAQGVYAEGSKLIGLVAGTSILKGQPVYANMLAGQSQGTGFSILLPGETVNPSSPAWRAVSITVPDDRAVGGLLQPGASVDVFVTSTITEPRMFWRPAGISPTSRRRSSTRTCSCWRRRLPRTSSARRFPSRRRSHISRRAARPLSVSRCDRLRTCVRSTRPRSGQQPRRSSHAMGCRFQSGTGRARLPLRRL